MCKALWKMLQKKRSKRRAFQERLPIYPSKIGSLLYGFLGSKNSAREKDDNVAIRFGDALAGSNGYEIFKVNLKVSLFFEFSLRGVSEGLAIFNVTARKKNVAIRFLDHEKKVPRAAWMRDENHCSSRFFIRHSIFP